MKIKSYSPRECPNCHKVKRFYYEICGECSSKIRDKEMTKSLRNGYRVSSFKEHDLNVANENY